MGKPSRRAKSRGRGRITHRGTGDHEVEVQRAARLVEGTEGEDPTLVELRQLELDHLGVRDRQWGQNRD